MKIADKLKEYEEKNKKFFSFEYFPPKTEAGVQNLYARIDRMVELEPAFIDVTWGAGGSTAGLTLDIVANAQQFSGVDVMMHLTCTNMHKEMIDDALAKAKDAGLTNILALRGDPPHGTEKWTAVEGGFSYAVDLVKYIKSQYGDHFSIGVAGYPEGHLECTSYEDDLKHLKAKIDAGGEFIVTQLFYDVPTFKKFMQDCKDIGITAPIVPGIMPIHGFQSFMKMTGFCKTKIPQKVLDDLEPIKDNDEAVKQYGVDYAIQMCKELFEAGVPGIHIYTLNLEKSAVKILEGLNLVTDRESRRKLPWRPSTVQARRTEDVRPIFWANRPKSYLTRTRTWDEFPNGRWGDARSPAFGDLAEHYIAGGKKKPEWVAEPIASEQDVWNICAKFTEGKLAALPWCDTSLSAETTPLLQKLAEFNKKGLLTINSQPRVNAASSSDPVVGWGGPDGFVYQKAYVEFFCRKELLDSVLNVAAKNPMITYHAVHSTADTISNSHTVNAVTWGVFPGKEIQQPTIVDPNVFENVWAEEAFSLWLANWAEHLPEGDAGRAVLKEIHDNYYLVNVVDNDFVSGNVWDILENAVA
eukprot:GFYU01002982.1.p1 GENE.GFYU01002982.1~~GFYU01002982.1.p1  ORF type:complete len:582 (+),score=244.51 GFYU01002982.1:67-1812(+)